MDNVILWLLLAVGLVDLLLLAVLLLRQKNGGQSGASASEALHAALGEMRQETERRDDRLRAETARSLSEVSAGLTDMTERNVRFQLEMQRSLSAAVEHLREKQAETGEKQSAALTAAVEKLQNSNERKLDAMRMAVDEKLNTTLTARLDSSFLTVSKQLENVYRSLGEMKELSAGVTDHVTALNRVLTNVKARGTWAEIRLEAVLNETVPGMFVRNYAPGNGTERVEFAVKLPCGEHGQQTVYLPVDSKFPMEDYIRLCDAADRADKAAVDEARKALEERVLAEAKTVRKYICPPQTTPFAVLYLATEGLYAEIASSRSGIAERIRREYGILLAGPSTVTALLSSLAVGLRTAAVNEKAGEIRKLLAAARAQYENFGILLEKARKKVEEAGKTLDDAQRRNDIIQKKLKSAEETEIDTGGQNND